MTYDKRPTTVSCHIVYVAPLDSRPLRDIWRCQTHQYDFITLDGGEPELCPVALGLVPVVKEDIHA